MSYLVNIIEVIGRILLAYFFIPSGISKITGYTATAALMTSHGIPSFLLPLVILTEIGGGLLMLVGWQTRIVAFLLGGYSFIAIAIFWLHPTDALGHLIQTAELAAAGGVWVLAARGSGPWSLDAFFARRRSTQTGVVSPQV